MKKSAKNKKTDNRLTNIDSEATLVLESKSDLKKGSEVIFDASYLTYKEIIGAMESSFLKNKALTYKILPNNSNFIVGSDDGYVRGEVIILN